MRTQAARRGLQAVPRLSAPFQSWILDVRFPLAKLGFARQNEPS